jgi:hypothetical protein
MNLEQIATGDFSSIQGTWKNNAGQSFIITGDQYSNPATGYIGTLKVFVDDYGINLGAYKNGIPMQLAIVPIPAGTEISGSMFGSDYSLSDQSDLTRDRFVVSPNGISSVDTKTLVYYKQ